MLDGQQRAPNPDHRNETDQRAENKQYPANPKHEPTVENRGRLANDCLVNLINIAMDAVTEIQRLFPRVYLACHTHHVKARSNAHSLSARDATILAHLESEQWTGPGQLARHLGIAPGTLSEATTKLEELGYLEVTIDPEDERRRRLRMTVKGTQAMKGASVLNTARLSAVLELLTEEERKKAVGGLRLLADAARRYVVESQDKLP